MKEFKEKINEVRDLLTAAECVVIGGGAGLSAAAGLLYEGERFTENFSDFCARYGMRDMYSAGFYPFASQEEKWAYWSRHILMNRFSDDGLPLYRLLYTLVRRKDCFVVTTNVDRLFYKSGFAAEKIFAVQGDYGKIQCARGCHDTLYDDEDLVRRMSAEQRDCRVPSGLIPRCPVCGGDMEVNIRKDGFFVEDEAWREASRRYDAFIRKAAERSTLLIELGVGFNTPSIIRFPFERMTNRNADCILVRVNRDASEALAENVAKTISFDVDIGLFLQAIADLQTDTIG